MLRNLALAAALGSLALPATAQEISDRLASDGLIATEAHLAALPSPTPSDQFALGGVRFLRAVERALQTRYTYGITQELDMLPILRLPVAANPSPDPFDPAAIETLFAEVERDMAGAIEALDTIGDGADVGVVLNLETLWLDIDGDGRRSDGEALPDIVGWTLGLRLNDNQPLPEIRFDTADAKWLSAYAHLVSAYAEAVQALSPTEAIAEVMASIEAYERINAETGGFAVFDAQFGGFVDLAAMVLMSIEQQPDPEHSRAALEHLRAMTADNRIFWARVFAETDNDREFIPNDNQTSVMGLAFPPGTGEAWLAVLKEAEQVLAGTRLVPFWRLGDGAGINLARIFEDPPEIDIIALVQGVALLPYVEKGEVMSTEAFARFDRLVQGESILFAVVLN